MLKPISTLLVASLVAAPMLGGACAPLVDPGSSVSDGGTRADGSAGNTSTSSDATSLIYVMSESLELYSFNPATSQFVDIGTSDCSGAPHSIAIDRNGNAYVLTYSFNGTDQFDPPTSVFYRMDLSNGRCELTSNVTGQQGFTVFGMAFSANGNGPDETLYLQGSGDFQSTSGLATLDTTTFELTVLPNSKPIYGGQLTGSGDGHLYGLFYPSTDTEPPHFGEIDKTNGNAVSSIAQPQINTSDFSVAYWGEDFYFFTSDGYTSPQISTVTRYSPAAGTFANVATLQNDIIVAAGVSTNVPR